MIHYLKCWPQYFERLHDGSKRFEVREDDRGFQTGDGVMLQEYDPNAATYSGRQILFNIKYTLHGPQFGIESGHCVMSLSDPIEVK